MIKKLLIGLIVQSLCCIGYSQEGYFRIYDEYMERMDSLPIFGITRTDNVIALGVKEFDSLVFVRPSKNVETYENIAFKSHLTDVRNIRNYNDYPYFEDFNYHIFDSTGYLLINWSDVIWDIIPMIPEKYGRLLYDAYPERISFFRIKINEWQEGDWYDISRIDHKKYLCLLMKLSYYNNICKKVSPHGYLLKNSHLEEGLYVKVLIPIKD